MANIKFSYLYRDSANYKNYNDVVFANPGNVNIEVLKKLILSKLIEGEFFRAADWLLPDLHFGEWDCALDHPYHEFESVDATHNSADFSVSLWEWMERVKAVNNTF